MASLAYDALREKVRELEKQPQMTQRELVQKLLHDAEVDWSTLKTNERQQQGGSHLQKHWKSKLIKTLSSPGRFEHGGHRSRLKCKGDQQNEIVQYVHRQLDDADDDMDTQTIAEMCIQKVAQRWISKTPQGTVVIHQVIRMIVGGYDGAHENIIKNFDGIEIEPVTSDVPSVAGIPLRDFASINHAVLHEMVILKQAEFERDSRNSEANSMARQKEAESAARQKEAECNVRVAQATMRQREVETEVDRINAKIRLLEAQREGRKRKADVLPQEQIVERDIANPWRGMTSFTAAVWRAREDGESTDIVETVARVEQWVRKDGHMQNIRHRLRTLPKHGNVVVAYCDTNADLGPLVHAFWHPESAPPSNPANKRNKRSLPQGVHDLVEAVLGPLGMSNLWGCIDNVSPPTTRWL